MYCLRDTPVSLRCTGVILVNPTSVRSPSECSILFLYERHRAHFYHRPGPSVGSGFRGSRRHGPLVSGDTPPGSCLGSTETLLPFGRLVPQPLSWSTFFTRFRGPSPWSPSSGEWTRDGSTNEGPFGTQSVDPGWLTVCRGVGLRVLLAGCFTVSFESQCNSGGVLGRSPVCPVSRSLPVCTGDDSLRPVQVSRSGQCSGVSFTLR